MHSESLTQAILGTALLFNTVFEIPDDMSLMGQIFGVGMVAYMLFWSIEKVREWELLLKKRTRRAATHAGNKKYYDLFIINQIRRKCKMFEKMSDGDVAVYLRNAALQMLRLSQERGVDITIDTRTRGYMNVRVDDYEIYKSSTDTEISYQYHPLDGSGAITWREDIIPQSIRFGMPPQEVQNGK